MSPQSFNTITPGNLELTPCRVTYKGVDIGATLGNVSVKLETALSELKADQLGSTPIDHKVSGHKYTIEMEFAEVKFKDNWKILFPMNKEVTQGLNKSMYFDSELGFSMRSLAGPLVLHPLSLPDTDKSQDFYFYLASADAKTDYVFSPSEQVKLKTTFMVYPDFTTTPARFFVFGDPAVGLVDATAGSATAGTGNVGNGTVGSITVFSGFTMTETVSLLCTNPTEFFVSGSQSGALGLAEVGITFTADQISFLITAGGTPFAAGDSFQIATVAANYS